ncbi:MAG: hypothetical protein M1840_001186 [Geoglossum simile]|nr:MAG: hypothetical protein M1840_001186 [Geoglossum simile]
MAIPFDRIISSAPFKFLVGPENKPFMVHAALVSHHSRPLDVLMNGEMLEAREGCACLEDVDEETFVRFSQYLYTGDYSATTPDPPATNPHHPPRRLSEVFPVIELEPFQPGGPYGSRCRKCGRQTHSASKRSEAWDEFENTTYPALQPCESPENPTPIFLSHVRLYAFAEKYDIASLKDLTLHKLHRTLSNFPSCHGQIGDIVDLLQCSYEVTADREGGAVDGLRRLVIHYATCVVEDLAPNERFQGLLEDGGQFARDLFRQMLKRLS